MPTQSESHKVQQQEQEQTTLIRSVDDLVGTVFAGKYEILQLVGKGGMSSVYKAKHLLLGKLQAIKLMHKHLVTDSNAITRFRQEAAAASSLAHPNIINVHDFDTEGNLPYMAIDFLDGKSLSEVIREDGAFPPERAVKVFIQACGAVGHAHTKGVIHRDLKPSNIMLITKDGDRDFVKIVDFGIAKILPQDGEVVQQLTQTGDVFGSPLYMSPEQCLGHKLDSRSDVYSMGCLMYETLTGHAPFIGTTVFDTIQKHIAESPKSLKDELRPSPMVERLDAIVQKALAKEPSQRYQTMEELVEDLQKVQEGKSSHALESILRKFELAAIRVQPVMKRAPIKLLASLSLTVLLLLVSIAWFAQVMVTGNIPAYATIPWPQFSQETDSQETISTNNSAISTAQMAMDGLLSRILRMEDPVAKAKRLASLARIFAQNGNYEDATTMAKYLKSALDECPPNFDVRNLYDDGTTGLELIKWLRAIADACYAKKDFKLAAYFYTKAQTSLGSSSTFTHRRLSMKLADAYLQDNRIRDAETMFKRAAGASPTSELNPDLFIIDKNDMFCEDRAIWMSKVGDIDAAMAKYPQAAIAYFGAAQEWAKEPTLAYSGQSFFRLAQCYEKLGKWKDAELALRDSIKQLSSSPNAAGKANLPAVWKELADVLQQQNKVWDSLQASKEAHSLAKELAK